MDIEELRKYCLSLPSVTEDVKWENNLVFSIAGKMFCLVRLEPPLTFSFKVSNEQFDEIVAREGFVAAPYLARAKWVLVKEAARLHTTEWQTFLRYSYELVKKKLPGKIKADLSLD
jgi:predicted DNA-binding protein (MmcQ/YjbR family)